MQQRAAALKWCVFQMPALPDVLLFVYAQLFVIIVANNINYLQVSNSQHDLSLNKSHSVSEQEDISGIKMQRLLTTGQDLPARRLDHMYFVLDTNVLMDNLLFVEDLCHVALGETNGSMLYIPYIVIKELDKLKDRRDDNELKRLAAIRAIRYLNKKFDDSLKIQGMQT